MIESLNYPGQATTMRCLLKYPDDFSKAQDLNQLWYKDTSATAAKPDNNGFVRRHAYLLQSPTVKGTFTFIIPMKQIFWFGDAALVGVKFFGMNELITQSNITPSDYKTHYPLFTFDFSKQKEKQLKSSVVDIQI